MFLNRQLGYALALAVRLLFGLAVLASVSAIFAVRASGQEEFDEYKLRLVGYWFYSSPTGTIQGHADSPLISIGISVLALTPPAAEKWTGNSLIRTISTLCSSRFLARSNSSSLGPSPSRAKRSM